MAADQLDFVSPLPHPGEILREDFMEPMGLTAGALSRAMGLKDRTRIERLSREMQPVTAETAARLGRVFNTSAQFWLNMQTQHDLSLISIKHRDALAAIKPLAEARSFEPEPALVVADVASKSREPVADKPAASVPFAGDVKRGPMQKGKR